jgi:hypothetical protein
MAGPCHAGLVEQLLLLPSLEQQVKSFVVVDMQQCKKQQYLRPRMFLHNLQHQLDQEHELS